MLRSHINSANNVAALKRTLKSISATDGRKINITYSGNNNSTVTIQGNSSVNPIHLVYSNSNAINAEIKRGDGKYWRYNFASGGYFNQYPSRIEYPNGLKVSYDYELRGKGLAKKLHPDIIRDMDASSITSVYRGYLKTRTITGNGMDAYVESYTYHSTGHLRSEDSVNTTFIKSVAQSIEYMYRKINTQKSPQHTPVNSGRLISKKVFPKGTIFSQRGSITPLKKIEYDYERTSHVVDLGFLTSVWSTKGIIDVNNFYGLYEGTHHSYRTKVSKKTTQINGYTFTTNYDYDAVYGQLKTITESNTLGDSRITRKTYHNDKTNWIIGKLKLETVDSESANSSFAYNSKGALTRKTIHGISEYFYYHGDGNLKYIKQYKEGALRTVSTFTSYHRGVAKDTTDGVGNTKETILYDFGQVKSETDFNGNKTHYEYDAIHRLKKINPPGSRSTTYISWPTELKKVTTQGSYKQTVDYNAMMQPTLVTEEDVGRNEKIYTKTTYDSAGRTDVSSFPSSSSNDGVGRKYTYDGLGRPKTIKHTVDNSITGYCYGVTCGYGTKHGTRIIDARGYKTIKNYRAYGNSNSKHLTSIKEEKTGNAYITTTIARGKHGQTTSINQGGKNRTFEYQTGTLLLSKKTDPEVGNTHYYYDARGNITQKNINLANSTSYTYDNNDRIEHINYPGSTLDVSYEYSGSNLEKITTGSNNTVLDYLYWANSNDIKYETLTVDGLRFITHYQYDNLGNLDYVRLPSIEYPSASRVINSTVDALGRTREITDFVSGVKYHPNGALSDMTYNNGSVFKSTLNNKRIPNMLRTLKGSQTIVNLNYNYDKNNNVSGIINYQNRSNDRGMGYDGLNRMTTANGRWGSGNIEYTDNHDIDNMTLGSTTLYYGYDNSGKLTHTTGSINKNFTYDSYGNVSGNGTDNFIYDDANQMLKVSNQNINYTYDGNKKRVKVQTPEKTVYYFYNLAGELLYRYDKTNNKDIEYINLNGKLIAKFEQQNLAAPAKPILLSPGGTLTDIPSLFYWNAVPTATGYVIKVNGNIEGVISSGAATCSGSSTCVLNTSPKGVIGANTWQVQASNSTGSGAWSDLKSFTVDAGGTTNTSLNETNISGVTGQYIRYTIDVPAGTTALDINLTNVSGDPELLVDYGAQPTISSYDCASENGAGGDETCHIDNPQAGTWHIAVYGYADFSGATLTANTTGGSSSGTSNTSLNETNISGVTGQYIHYTLDVPAGATALDINLTNVSGDPELLVDYGAQPTIGSYECASENGAGGDETCHIDNPQAGTWHIAVYGYDDFSNAQLTASVSTSGTGGSSGTLLSHTNLSGTTGQYLYYTVEVLAGTTTLDVDLTNITGDPELFVRYEAQPTTVSHQCGSENSPGSDESCRINNPLVGTWHIGVYGYTDFSNAQLTAKGL